MKYLELLEEKTRSKATEEELVLGSILSSPSISGSLYTLLQKHCDKMFDIWIDELTNNGTCENDELFLHKIHYSKAQDYNEESEIFKFPGIYLWGCGNIPRYIGKTESSFEDRLFNRYLPRKNDTKCKHPTQCVISEILRDNYRSKLDDFEESFESKKTNIKEMVEKEKGITIESYERLYGALDFSRFKKEEIWFALLPFENRSKEMIDIFETLFIHSAQNYNKEHNYDELLNKGKTRKP